MNPNSIISIRNCFGCGVCASVCPNNIISIKLNNNGFYEPYISEETKCIRCGLCVEVCAYSHKDLARQAKPIKSWAAWSDDLRVRRKCSSGGVAFEICKQLLEDGYKAVVCRYDVHEQRAEHYIAKTVEELVQSMGSKYIQSFTEETFKRIDRKQKYIVTGTPCQIDSFRRMIQKFHCEDNFILMDFFCHCVPSMFAWKAYSKMLEPQIGKITYASWRNKYEYGWHDSWLMGIDGDKRNFSNNQPIHYDDLLEEKRCAIQSRLSQGDAFYKLFLGDVCLGPQCENDCKYKYDSSSADIRIGDLWGDTYKNDKNGVSALIAFTEKGRSLIESMKNVTLVEHPFDVVAEGQMKKNAKRRETYYLVMYMLKHGYSLNGFPFKFTFFIQRVISKIKSIFKK